MGLLDWLGIGDTEYVVDEDGNIVPASPQSLLESGRTDRGILLPMYTDDGWVAPEIARYAIQAFEAPGRALSGNVTPEDAANFAMTFTGGGLMSNVGRKPTAGLLSQSGAGPKKSITAVDLRTMTEADALNAAKSGVHLKRSKSGQYVGAPRGVDSPQKLAAMRSSLDELIGKGQQGADWYPNVYKGTDELAGGDPRMRDLLSNEYAHWSVQSTPETNLQFQLQAHNAYELGQPLNVVRTGRQWNTYKNARDQGLLPELGPKTGIYEGHINPNKASLTTGTNDIWHARNFGYKNADGSTFSRGLSAQEHSFMDAETVLAANRANRKGLAGKTDWGAGSVQAAPWVYSKGVSLHKRFPKKFPTEQAGVDEAAKVYPDFFNKHTVYATHEAIPGAGLGHLPDLPAAHRLAREAYSADPRSSWMDAGGRDAIYQAMVPGSVRPTTKAQGIYRNPMGEVEFNPGGVARPLVALADDAGGKTVRAVEQDMLNAGESLRAYLDAQNMGAWHKMIPQGGSGAKAGASTSFTVPMKRALTESEASRIFAIAQKHGLEVSDTGSGVSLMNFGDGPSAKQANKVLKELSAEVAEVIPKAKVERARLVSGATMVDDSFTPLLAEPGSGKATRGLLEVADQLPAKARQRLSDPTLRQKALHRFNRDAEVAEKTGSPLRADIQKARAIFNKGGLEGLRKALSSGDVLPAVALPILALYGLSGASESEMEM